MSTEEIQSILSSVTIQKVFPAILVLIVGYVLIQLIIRAIKAALKKTKLDSPIQSMILTIVRIALWAILIIAAAGVIGVNISSLVAVLSIASLAISLAVQGILGNIAGGLQIVTAHPFRIGDYIETEGLEGYVSSISLVYTTITTRNNLEISLPNSELSEKRIINHTKLGTRRMEISVPISYESNVKEVKELLLPIAQSLSCALKDPTPEVVINAFRESDTEYLVRVWIPAKEYWDAWHELHEKLKLAIDNHPGVSIPFPQVDVHLVPED